MVSYSYNATGEGVGALRAGLHFNASGFGGHIKASAFIARSARPARQGMGQAMNVLTIQ